MSELTDLQSALSRAPARITLTGVPEGHDAYVLGGLVTSGAAGALLHVCRDDGRMARFAAAMAFFHPKLKVLTFPAWDCLPYDRVSPNAEIVSRRIDTLTTLADGSGKGSGIVVLTTVNAAVQRVPPRALFRDRMLVVRVGERVPTDRLMSFFARNGYTRTDTVREAGEFAIRGGIVDVFPSGGGTPARLDFFGDTLDAIRSFDALTQRTTGKLTRVIFKPMSEVLLDDKTIHRFRSRYREQFGTVADDDPLYEAVSAGRRYVGMEHWLPLYYETLETVFDYLPEAVLTLDHQAEDVRRDRLESVADFYAARKTVDAARRGVTPLYRPVKPEQLYLDDKEWGAALASRPVAQLSPFAAPASEDRSYDAGARPAWW